MLKSLAFLPIFAVLLLCNLLPAQAQGVQAAAGVIASNEMPAAIIPGFLPDIIAPAAAAETEPSQQQPQDQPSQQSAGRRSLVVAAELVFIGFMLGLLAAYVHRKYFVSREGEEIFPETSNPLNPEQVEPAKTVQQQLVSVPVQAKPGKQVTDAMETLSEHVQTVADTYRGFMVDEIDSVVEQAKLFVALGRTHRAIDLLVDNIDTNRETPAETWVYLMDLYRNLNDKRQFDVLAVRFKNAFNVVEPQWDCELVDLMIPVSLDEFPYIENKLVALWGTSECVNFLTELIRDNREGTRVGFSMEVFSEMLLLIAIAEMRDDMPGVGVKPIASDVDLKVVEKAPIKETSAASKSPSTSKVKIKKS